MSTDNRFNAYTLPELLEARKKILARPFPSGWDSTEHHCTWHFGTVVEALREMIQDKKDGPFFRTDEHPPGSTLHTAEAALVAAEDINICL